MTRVVFMGTPAFAVPSLKGLIDDSCNIVGVFCQPDRPKGRSGKPQPCPVKQCALAHNLPVFQPQRIRKKVWRQQLEALEPDLIVVAAYGQILSQRILDIPPLGCINVHASRLPRWRGAAPIQAAIAAGDTETGIAIMKMTLGLDEGPVFSERTIPITPTLGGIELANQLAQLGSKLLSETWPKLASISPTAQDPSRATYAPMIKKAMGYCDFENQTANEMARLTRAFEGWPNLMCQFRNNPVKILAAQESQATTPLRPGQISVIGKKTLLVGCAQNTLLQITLLQPAGKKAMEPHAFINGYRPKEDEGFDPVNGDQPRIPFP